MRQVMADQKQLGETDISEVALDPQSRDEIPQVLAGLKQIYSDPEIRREVFAILEKLIPAGTRTDTGRWGMDLWKILVMGVLRLACNWDFDHLHDQANNHRTIRQVLGHGLLNFFDIYSLQTIKDNVSLFTPAILAEINQIVVKAGHRLLGKTGEPLKAKGDSFVVETNVHYPTDINLLWDALRKLITLIAVLCDAHGLEGWRQFGHWLRKIKKAFRKIQKLKSSTSKDEQKQAAQKRKIQEAHQIYIDLAREILARIETTLTSLPAAASKAAVEEIKAYMTHAQRQVNQIERRVIQGETIPHAEKVFSIFEPHTRWISKGKAGVPQELGLPVCIMEDQYGFILAGLVMETEIDKDVAVSFTKAVKAMYPNLSRGSFDQGFYSPGNQKELSNVLDVVILPKKGRLSVADQERESSEAFVEGRRQHPAIESAINGLETAGLDRCPDHGLDGFKRYVGLSILARNLQTLGKVARQKEKKKELKKQMRQAA